MGFQKGKLRCKPRTAQTLDRTKALEQAARGMSNPEIAKVQGVNKSTVWRFMQRMQPERQALESFKSHRADVLARLQAKSLDAQERIVDTLKDDVIEALTPSQKSGFLMSLNAQHGTSFDKERLERGFSTSNQSIMSKMLDNTVDALYREPAKLTAKTHKRTAPAQDVENDVAPVPATK